MRAPFSLTSRQRQTQIDNSGRGVCVSSGLLPVPNELNLLSQQHLDYSALVLILILILLLILSFRLIHH